MSWAYLFNALIVVGLSLQLLVLNELIGGAYRKYPLLLIYSFALLAATVAESTRFLTGGFSDADYRNWYWINDTILRSLLFFIVISLIATALKNSPSRKPLVRLLGIGAVLVVGVSLFVSYDFSGGHFRNSGLARTGSNLSFAATLFSLALWASLLRQRDRDWQLLRLTAGLGVSVSGESIAHAMRAAMQRETTWVVLPNLLAVLSNLGGLYIWWRALRTPPAGGVPRS